MRRTLVVLALTLTFAIWCRPAAACPTPVGPPYTEAVLMNDTWPMSDCYYRSGYSTLVVYWKRVKYYDVNMYQNMLECSGYITKKFLSKVYSYTTTCWSPTTTSCVGNKDWAPSPICN